MANKIFSKLIKMTNAFIRAKCYVREYLSRKKSSAVKQGVIQIQLRELPFSLIALHLIMPQLGKGFIQGTVFLETGRKTLQPYPSYCR